MTVTIESRLEWKGDEAKVMVQRAAHLGIGAVAKEIAREARASMGRGQTGRFDVGPPGGPPGVDTGTLKRSVTFAEIGPFAWAVGTNNFYGAIHEFGGTHYSTGRQFTVPLNPKAKLARLRHTDLRAVKGLFLLKTKRGVYLAKKIGGRNARVELWYALKKKITHPPRPWLRPAADIVVVSGRAQEIAIREAKKYLRGFVRDATGGAE